MRRFYPALGLCALALAALSLLAPSTPSYDPWAWLVWGRELVALELDTTAGPAWKPLTVLAASLLAPLGDAAPDAWLVLSRAVGIASVALTARVAYRAAPRRRLLAAIVAAVSLLLVVGFARGVALGTSEAAVIALGAAALDRHLDGARRFAFVLGAAAALLRPEVWPLLALYGVWLWRRGEARSLVVAAAVAVPALWFLPELWGSGDVLRSSERARVPNPGAPTLADFPSLEVVRRFPLMLPPLVLGAVFARGPQVRVLALAAAAWLGTVALMSELGYSGEERYLIPAAAIVAALAGIGWAHVASHRVAIVALTAVVVAPLPFVVVGARDLGNDLRDAATLRNDLERAVADAGDVRCGAVGAGRYRFPLVAWHLRVPISRVGFDVPQRGVVLRSRLRASSPLEPKRPSRPYALVAANERWQVWSSCA